LPVKFLFVVGSRGKWFGWAEKKPGKRCAPNLIRLSFWDLVFPLFFFTTSPTKKTPKKVDNNSEAFRNP